MSPSPSSAAGAAGVLVAIRDTAYHRRRQAVKRAADFRPTFAFLVPRIISARPLDMRKTR